MRLLASVATLGLLLAVPGCSQFSVRTRQDPAVDLAAFRTFGWLPASEGAPADQRVQDRAVAARLRAAVENELRAKGYAAAAEGQPADFLVNWRITSQPMIGAAGQAGLTSWGAPWWPAWHGGSGIYSESYDTGTLFLGILDGGSRRIVWLGAAQARLLPHVSLERRLKRVDAAVHDTLESFPQR